MSDNNRNYGRIPREYLIEFSEFDFSGDKPSIPSSLKDISGGGVRFETPQPIEIGTMLKMKLSIPGWDRHKTGFLQTGLQPPLEPLVTLGRVVRVDRAELEGKYDIGVAFECIDEDHRSAVMKHLEHLKEEQANP